MNLVDTVRPTTWMNITEVDSLIGKTVWFASETEQVTNSFKYRAATSLVQNVDAPGFLVASSGNFGQALARACQLKEVPCIVVMPTTSAQVKVDAVRSYGAQVVFVNTAVQTRADKVLQIAKMHPNYHVASPYDCPWVIKGNASLGGEIHRHHSRPTVVLVPVGGGGLISGIATALERHGNPVQLWGVEPKLADDAARSLEVGQRVFNDGEPKTLADGARTRSVGVHNWEIIQRRVSKIIRVSESTLCTAVRLFHHVGVTVEPTAALTLAALLEHDLLHTEIVAVVSGKNVDSTLYDAILSDAISVTE